MKPSHPNAADHATARERVKRVFQYLQALHEHRSPVPRQMDRYWFVQWIHELPEHESIEFVGMRDELESDAVIDEDGVAEGRRGYVLRVRRPKLTEAPTPPEILQRWIKHWANPEHEPQVEHVLEETTPHGEVRRVWFDEDPERLAIWNDYLGTWRDWAARERPARRAARFFERLFSLYTTLQREGEQLELVLGDGILAWRPEADPIHHPLLLQSLQLEFEPKIPEFTLVETDKPVEFYSALFRSIPSVPPKWLNQIESRVQNEGYHPLGGESTTEFFRQVVGMLSPHGRFEGENSFVPPGAHPVIRRAPVLFARTRAQGFSAFLERAIEYLDNGGEISPVLGNIVGIQLSDDEKPEDFQHTPQGEEPERILFSIPANPEQVLAAEYLEYSNGVVVQGPPGTGKTHTIANILGHLLAKGNSVLVTSHTSKALRVLREKVVEPLRPLCVSVLDSHSRSQQELEEAVRTIINYLGSTDPRQLETKAENFARQRSEILNRLRQRRAELIRARAGEYEDLVLDGQRISPSDAAREVAAGVGKHDWIPSPVTRFQPLPLSVDEINELYATNSEIPQEYETELQEAIPELDSLPTPADFRQLLSALSESSRVAASDQPDLWRMPPRAEDEARLTELAGAVEEAITPLMDNAQWPLAVVAAALRGEAEGKPWRDLIKAIEAVIARAKVVQPKIYEFGPELPSEPALEEQVAILEEIHEHMKKGRGLGKVALLFHPRWKALLRACRVDGREPRTIQHIDALLGLAQLCVDRQALRRRWDRQMTPLGAPSADTLGAESERVAKQYADRILQLLQWDAEHWRPVEKGLEEVGFRWEQCVRAQPPVTGEYGDLIRLRETCRAVVLPLLRARAAAARCLAIEEKVRQVANTLAPFGHVPVIDRLRGAVYAKDAEQYEAAYRHLAELWRYKLVWNNRVRLLSRLAGAAPEWARCIRERMPPHDRSRPPGDPILAWRWRQFNDELERRAVTDPDAITAEIERLQRELYEVTAKLIEHQTWARQHARTGLDERQALMGYRDAVKRIGRGTGKRAPIFRAEAQRLMSKCRTAVPVWIMPLSRVVDTFDPRTTQFDVVIIDEASQCDVMGLLAFFLGKKVLVVGDDEQVSPAAVGQNVDVVQRLIEQHLVDIPNSKLYDGQMSIYELAQQSFTRNLRLREHFRCVPDIIEFSNHLSYQGDIKPLRDASSVVLKPHVIEHVVARGYEERKINKPEAYEIASLLVAAIEQPEYTGKTFGVISLLGDEQAMLIEKIIRDHLPTEVIEDRKILCGNAAQFQGDERDVIFLSMVKSRPLRGGPLALMGDGYLNENKKRFNVAASRARDQMWVVHSLNPATDLKHGDLRLRLIQHAQNPNAVVEATRRAQSRAESEFEKQVIAQLIGRGYRVTPQWWVGYYRIDLVVEGPNGAKVAIECDGDRFHAPEKLVEDLARQAVLERLGWRFIRIRGSEFFRDPESTMQRVISRLQALGIEPDWQSLSTPTASSDLVDRVRRRAAELRREWGVDSVSGAQLDLSELMDDQIAMFAQIGSDEEAAEKESKVSEDADDIEADWDRHDGHGLECPICLESSKQLVLYRGKEICVDCVALLTRDRTTVPARTSLSG